MRYPYGVDKLKKINLINKANFFQKLYNFLEFHKYYYEEKS